MDADFCLIPLTQGQFAKVSPHRFEEINRFKWYALWCESTQSYYAQRGVRMRGGRRTITMHRFILGLDFGNPLQGDHRNHDTLDNTDDNLRIATPSQQCSNMRSGRRNSTGFKGVRLKHGRRVYTAQIMVEGRSVYLGQRPTAEAAYRDLYVPAAIRYHGEFACL